MQKLLLKADFLNLTYKNNFVCLKLCPIFCQNFDDLTNLLKICRLLKRSHCFLNNDFAVFTPFLLSDVNFTPLEFETQAARVAIEADIEG